MHESYTPHSDLVACQHSSWSPCIASLQDRLLSHELDYIASVHNPPVMAATVLTQLVAAAHLPDMLQISLDGQIAKYVDSVGACERLNKQPIPVAYTR